MHSKYKPGDIFKDDVIVIIGKDVGEILLTEEYLSISIKREKAEKYINIDKLKDSMIESD